jgi:hypothetical protein
MSWKFAAVVAVSIATTPQLATATDFYHLAHEVAVPGPGAAYDYVAFGDGKLYVGHRPEGLQVFDTKHDFAMTTIADTKGSNGAMLMPDLGIGASHNGDGTLTVFQLADGKTTQHIKLGDELDSSRYDPVTHRLAVFGLPTEKGKAPIVAVLQAPGMERVGTMETTSEKLEHSAADGTGGMYVAAQDKDMIVHFDMKDLKQTASYPTPCKQPTGLALDAPHKRLMISCRGDYVAPMFVVMNTETGAFVAKLPISPGNDGLAFDAAHGKIFATNGIGANLVVIAQKSPDEYAIDQVIGTRMMAKTLALDADTGDIYTITAEGVFDPSRKNLAYIAPFYPNGFTPNSFRVLQYSH